ncbi:MAG: hypothetical protein EA364_03280 [Balneolaceae bacterium]|nr:MAG: hypothetical protein EA364_03280 [Balneolaceae bacterium]
MWPVAVIVVLMVAPVNARQSVLHQAPDFFVSGREAEIRFTVSGFTPSESQPAYVLIRETGRQTFRRIRAEIADNSYVAKISAGVMSPPSVEYYILVENLPGGQLSYPPASPDDFPVTVQVIPQEDVVTYRRTGVEHNVEYTILTPLPDERVPYFDVAVAVALYSELEIGDSELGIIWNRTDVSDQADISGRFVSYIPQNVRPGTHSVEIYRIADDRKLTIVRWDFSVYDPDAAFERAVNNPFIPYGSAEVGYRNQSFGGFNQNMLTGQTRLAGGTNEFRYNLSALITSEETSRLQAQNRYSADLQYRNIFQVQLGDLYPDMNPFMISGRRILGVETAVRTLRQNLNFYFLFGQLNRRVGVRYGEIEKQIFQVSENISDSVYVLGLRESGGAYRRDILAARLEVGNNRPFRLGLNMMRIQDDTSSLTLFDNIDDLPDRLLSTPIGAEARDNPDQFRINNPGIRPQGNFVLATDIQFNADRNRIHFQSDMAASLMNNDISAGILTEERAEELGYFIDSKTVSWIERFSWFIIINENMNATPFRLDEDQTEVFVPSGIFANHNRMQLNYFNHTLSVQYRWVGPDYTSLASSGLRRDYSGFLISDRVRFLSNTLFITGSFENYRDNVINNRSSTTWTNGYRLNTSWFPADRDFPNISIGITYQDRDNGIARTNPWFAAEPAVIRNAAVRNISIVNGDTVVTATPRNSSTLQITGTVSKQFEWLDATNEASISFSNIATRDNGFYYGEFNGFNLSLGLRSLLRRIPMKVNMTASISRSESLAGLNSTNIAGINAAVSYEFLDQRLNVFGDLGYASRTSDLQSLTIESMGGELSVFNKFYVPDAESLVRIESNSYIVRAGSRFNIDWNHAVALDLSYNNVVSKGGFGAIPNDRFLQIRYIFNL